MADSKVVAVGSEWSPGFIEELLPCSQQISLLYHISYLCLAKFPKLERLLRMRAVETQLLFGSSEGVLLKCVGTSQNLISSLFPMLIHAIEKNKPTLAVKYLEKARTWISDIVQDVDKMVQRYIVLNRDVATTTSEIITERKETETRISKFSQDIQSMMKTLNVYEGQLNNATKQLEEKEKKIEAKNRELQKAVTSATSRSSFLKIFAIIVPFIGPLVSALCEATSASGNAKARNLQADLDRLISEKNSLKQDQWNLNVKVIDWNMQLAKLKIEQGAIPDPVLLGEVQRFLSKIQNILIKLKGFWERVYSLLGTLRDKTFVGEDLVDDPDLKDEFLQSIQMASEVWGQFSGYCNKAVQIFRVQSKDAYKFLEINPSSLSPEVWQQQYDSVKEQLLQLNVLGEEAAPAIRQ